MVRTGRLGTASQHRRGGWASFVPSSLMLLFLCAVTNGVMLQPGPTSTKDKPGTPTNFAPGVRIDWSLRVVEVDAKVILRDGPLELFACSEKTREHESVVVTSARPMHVFQAMGLIGLTSGSPVRYDAEHDKVVAATGEPLDLRVRFRVHGEERVLPIEAWMLDTKHQKPPSPIPWVFAGSRTFKSGRFGADADGTVICVVDFETAIIGAGTLHTADNDRLWLTANTKAIPPIGTPCTLLIRGGRSSPVQLSLLAGDRVTINGGKSMDMPATVEALQRLAKAPHRRRIVVTVAAGVPDIAPAKLVAHLMRLGWERNSVELKRAEPASPGGSSGRSP